MMRNLIGRLSCIAALFLPAALFEASAQQPTTATVACGVESHPVAINPDIVECHAAANPLPVIPDVIDEHNALFVREQGDWLLHELHKPERCGKNAKLRVGEACAVILYTLDEAHRQTGMPWTYVVKVYRISHPEDARNTIVFTMNHDSSERRLGGSNNDAWRLLADVRIQQRCRPRADNRVGSSASSGGLALPDSCMRMSSDMRYRPKLVLGRHEADRVLNKASVRRTFNVPAAVVDSIDLALREAPDARMQRRFVF